ncbi:Major facilitator-type transporter sorT [Fusarium oxysporum f. sp. albedinis]|nr:Major facilitator-type transporter sorT [Fusarium oxysporum f. sp. albedinis]
MSDHSQPPPENSSRAQLYIIVNPFTSYEQFLQLCDYFCSTRHLWSIVIEGPCLWRIYQGHLLDGDLRRDIGGPHDNWASRATAEAFRDSQLPECVAEIC